jgi:L-threonylcarbamoyladenylate synthase
MKTPAFPKGMSNRSNPSDPMSRTTNASIGNDVMRAVGSLCERKLVLIPTETEYVLACNALDVEALSALRALQGEATSPLEVYVPSVEKFTNYVKEVPTALARLAKRFLPGPMTFLLRRKHVISDWVTSGTDKVALRVPSHPLTLSLLNKLYFPLAVMSLPNSEKAGGVDADILDVLGERVGYVLDGGAMAFGPGATWVEMGEDCILVHRVGSVSRESIEKVSGLPTFQYLAPMTPARIATSV